MRLISHLFGGVVALGAVVIYSYALLYFRQTHGQGLSATAGGGPTLALVSLVLLLTASYLCWFLAR